MSKRAEQKANEAFPDIPLPHLGKDIVAKGGHLRGAYIQGYEQAEKDLALTWEDMAKIDAIILDTNNEFAVDYSNKISRQQFYEEVLKRFNEQRKK